jgi:hypothetical protein
MCRQLVHAVTLASAVASGGCSLLLDFSSGAAPHDAPADVPYTPGECAYGEPNDSATTAMAVTPGTDTGPAAICQATPPDEDWYKFSVPTGATAVTVSIQFVNQVGDLDLQLFSTTDTQTPVGQSRGFSDGESVTCPGSSPPCGTLAAGDYVFRVFPAEASALNHYTFAVAIQ